MPAAGPLLNCDAVKVLCEARDLTLGDVGRLIGVSGAHMSNVMNGNRGLAPTRVKRLADVLGVPTRAIVIRTECATCGASSLAS